MKTTVVIPNYNGMPYMETCLLAMRAQRVRPDRVIVVDNGSTDGSAEYVEQHFPEVTLIRMGENTGFCGAVNAGIRASGDAAYVILLNNDTEAEPDFTGALVGAMEGDPAIFSAQAKMLKMDDPEKMDDAGDFYCALGWAFARGKGKSASRYTARTDLFFSCAGAAIYRMRLLEETGLFDERHFAYLEDCDIGWRARILGYKNVFVPEARVKHVGSASSGSVYNLFKVRNTSRNSIYLIAKNMPALMVVINLPFLIPGFLVKALFFALKGYGREYVRGIGAGFRMSAEGIREGRHIAFQAKRLPQYLRIQLELLTGIVRRFAEMLP